MTTSFKSNNDSIAKEKRSDNYFHGKKPPVNASLLKLCSLFLSELRNDKGLLFKKI